MAIKFLKSFLGMCLLFNHLLTGSSAFARSGGSMDGGGGNQLIVQGCPILLDLYLANSTLNEDNCIPGVQLPDTKALRSISLDRINSKDSSIINQAINKLDLWKKNSPIVTGLIQEAMMGAPLFYTNYQIEVKDKHYSIPQEYENRITPQDLKTIAFHSKDFGVLISKKDFNQLSKKNQIALIIHESLRHVQIQYKFRMSDASIQKMAAVITNRGPYTNESLDTKEYADGGLLEKIELPKKSERKISELMTKVCETALPYRSKMIEMDQEQLDQVCFSSNKIPLSDLTVKFRNIAISLDDVNNREPFWIVFNIASEANALAVGDKIEHIGSSVRDLTDATLDAKHAMGVDAAIDQANRGIGWLTGSKRQIQNALDKLVNDGFLKK